LLFPAGSYAQAGSVSKATPLEIVYGPLVINQPSNSSIPLVIENKIFFPTAEGQTAIVANWPTTGSAIQTSIIIRNVSIAPGNGFYWTNGIHLTNAWLAQLTNVNIIGPAGLPNPLMINALVLDGQSTDASITGYRCSGAVTCLYITGESEGVKVMDFTMIGCLHGVVAHTPGTEPALWLTNGHINATSVGVWLKNRREWMFSDVLIYAGNYFEGTKTWGFHGVLLENSPVGELRGVQVSSIAPEKTIWPYVVRGEGTDRINGSVGKIVW